jgi:hypothetical protein
MMKRQKAVRRKGMTRREFMKSTAAVGLVAAAGTIGFPNVLRGASPKEILIGHIHPLSGALGFDGQELKKRNQAGCEGDQRCRRHQVSWWSKT